MDIDRIINIIRTLKEEGAIASSPTMNLGAGKIAGTVESGDFPPVKNRNRYIYMKNSRRNWLQRRKPPQI